MDLPLSIFGAIAREGEIYFFGKECPYGIPDHPHILIRNKGTYLFLSTCSSKLDTAIRLASLRKWDPRTYPVILKDDKNRLMRDSYVNCNEFVELSAQEFGKLMDEGHIKRDVGKGMVSVSQLKIIREGIALSIQISDEDKDRILK